MDRNGCASSVPGSKAQPATSRQGQMGWAFVRDPQEGPGVTGRCPESGGTLMAVSSVYGGVGGDARLGSAMLMSHHT